MTPDPPLDLLYERSCQLADRCIAGEIQFLDAVDMAYSAAEFSGTVARVGPDLVQHVLACAFMGVLKGGGMTKISEINADDRKVIELDRQAERRKHRFHLVPFEEIQLGTEPQYLVKGIIPRVGLTVIWGPPKCGKSFWIFDVTMHVALGWPYRGRRVQQCPVVYCAFEGQNGISARVEAFRQTFPINADQPVPFYLEPVTLDLIADQAELIATIKRHLAIDRPAWVIRCVADQRRRSWLSVVGPIAAKILQCRECSEVPLTTKRTAASCTKRKTASAAVLPCHKKVSDQAAA